MKFRFVFIMLGCFASLFASPFKSPPTSSIAGETEGGYKFPCYISQINSTNVKSIYYLEGNTVREFVVADEKSLQKTNIRVADKNKIRLQCGDGYYVFNPQANKTNNNYFDLTCDDGVLRRENNEFCDKKCDITPLLAKGFVPTKTSLLPNEEAQITCPAGEITKSGVNFTATCQENGLINANNPKCFNQKTACVFKNQFFEEGRRLSCQGSFGLVILTCEDGKWPLDNEICNANCFANCKEDIKEINFSFEDLNEVIIEIVDDFIVIDDLVDFCAPNPSNNNEVPSECVGEKISCDFKGMSYPMGEVMPLNCLGNSLKFQCFAGGFINVTPSDGENFDAVNLTISDCEDAEFLEKKFYNFNTKKTLRDYKIKLFKERYKK